jgi:predicted membrane protein (TIGR00267 family)
VPRSHLPSGLRLLVERAALREVLMGAQDNLTNVLAVVLGVTIGSGRADFVALAGLASGLAEAVSMGGVLYNASRAEQRREQRSLGGTSVNDGRLTPVWSGVVTFISCLLAGLVPLLPFIVLPLSLAIWVSIAASVAGLFVLGALTGRIGGDEWWREGLRLIAVAGLAALAAAIVGAWLSVG